MHHVDPGMNLFGLHDLFQIIDASAPIVVGAPHHGTRPNVDADRGTGPVALALARRLNARAVIVSDLRRTVDVNKNPLRLNTDVRHHALRYQNESFRGAPSLIVEIHGHVSGQYDVEITTGFDLDASAPGDALFLEKLAMLKRTLLGAFASRLGHTPTLGVYPLDRDVQKTATDTFTFQKIRRARNLVGMEWYGLHIELNASLRTSRLAQSADFVEALSGALTTAIRAAFEPLPAEATIPVKGELAAPLTELIAPGTLRATLAPAKYGNDNVVVVHPDELASLGALDGDPVIVRNGDEELRSTVVSARTVRPSQAALPARVRRQISLSEKGQVTIGRPAPRASAPADVDRRGSAVVAREARAKKEQHVWLSPDEMQRAGWRHGEALVVQGQPEAPAMKSIILLSDSELPPRAAAVSHGLMERLKLTLGEVMMLRKTEDG